MHHPAGLSAAIRGGFPRRAPDRERPARWLRERGRCGDGLLIYRAPGNRYLYSALKARTDDWLAAARGDARDHANLPRSDHRNSPGMSVSSAPAKTPEAFLYFSFCRRSCIPGRWPKTQARNTRLVGTICRAAG